jgi:hypothetical protein
MAENLNNTMPSLAALVRCFMSGLFGAPGRSLEGLFGPVEHLLVRDHSVARKSQPDEAGVGTLKAIQKRNGTIPPKPTA